jgi:hypothetical protein
MLGVALASAERAFLPLRGPAGPTGSRKVHTVPTVQLTARQREVERMAQESSPRVPYVGALRSTSRSRKQVL